MTSRVRKRRIPRHPARVEQTGTTTMKIAAVALAIALLGACAPGPAAAQDADQLRIEVCIIGVEEKIGQFILSERSDDTEILDELVSRYREGEAEMVAAVSVVSKSGQRAKAEIAQEFPYATEFEDRGEGGLRPTAFEVRNVGTILEVDPVIGAGGATIDLNLAAEHHLAPPVMEAVGAGADENAERKAVVMPKFFVEKVTTAAQLKSGRARLLGTMAPAKVAEGSGIEGGLKGQLHFFFVKAVVLD